MGVGLRQALLTAISRPDLRRDRCRRGVMVHAPVAGTPGWPPAAVLAAGGLLPRNDSASPNAALPPRCTLIQASLRTPRAQAARDGGRPPQSSGEKGDDTPRRPLSPRAQRGAGRVLSATEDDDAGDADIPCHAR